MRRLARHKYYMMVMQQFATISRGGGLRRWAHGRTGVATAVEGTGPILKREVESER